MTRTPLSKLLLSGLLAGLLLSATFSAQALSSDAEQPIEIEADEFLLDDTEGLSVYTGSVVLIQGSMRVSGDKLTVKYNENNEIQEMLVDGKLAKFKQQDDSGDWTNGESIRIEYYPQKEEIYLLKKAKVTQAGRLFSGDRIVYDIARSIVKAHSIRQENTNNGDSAPKKRERVKIVLPPKKKP